MSSQLKGVGYPEVCANEIAGQNGLCTQVESDDGVATEFFRWAR